MTLLINGRVFSVSVWLLLHAKHVVKEKLQENKTNLWKLWVLYQIVNISIHTKIRFQ